MYRTIWTIWHNCLGMLVNNDLSFDSLYKYHPRMHIIKCLKRDHVAVVNIEQSVASGEASKKVFHLAKSRQTKVLLLAPTCKQPTVICNHIARFQKTEECLQIKTIDTKNKTNITFKAVI